MFVKICGVTNADDALLAAGLGADAIGMIFAASPRRITNAQAREIVRRLPPEVLTVGVFRNDGRERVVRTANEIGLRAVQLHGSESPDETKWIGERVQVIIKAFSIEDPTLSKASVDGVDGVDGVGGYGPHRLLVDSPMPGSGEAFDWSKLDRIPPGRPYILAGGLNPDNVADAIEMVRPWGVDVATGVESSPGRKDPGRVRRFLSAVRSVSPDDDGLQVDEQVTDVGQQGPFDWEEDTTWR